MAIVAPQINEDAFGTVVFTVTFQSRDYDNTTDNNGLIFRAPDTSGATIVGNNSSTLTITGVQPDVNFEMLNLEVIPSADIDINLGIGYTQNDNFGSPQNDDFMQMEIRNTHEDFSIIGSVIYDEDRRIMFTPGQITDERPDNIDSNIQYQVDLTLSDPAAGSLSQSQFIGTKDDINTAMTNIIFTPSADYTNNIILTYTQTQLTDGISQNSDDININIGSIHIEYVITDNVFYGKNLVTPFTPGQITDERPDNIDSNIQYQVDLTLSDPAAGSLSQSQFIGTKDSLNSELSTVQFIPSANYEDDFNISYTQTQTTDSVAQGVGNIVVENLPYENLWSVVENKPNVSNFRIYHIDYTDGLFLCALDSGWILRSDNNGVSWTAPFRVFPADNTFQMYAIASSTNGVCIAAGENGFAAKSSNYGLNWSNLTQSFDGIGSAQTVRSVATNNTGVWITGGNKVTKSIDDGINWEELANVDADVIRYNEYTNTWFACASGELLRSFNNGDSWVPDNTVNVTDISFSSNGTSIAIQFNNEDIVYRSTDNFTSNTIINLPSVLANSANIIDIDNNNNGTWMMMVDDPNYDYFVSYDDGLTWEAFDGITFDHKLAVRSNKDLIWISGGLNNVIHRSPNATYNP